MSTTDLHYRITDTIGTSGTLTTDGDLTVQEFVTWYGAGDEDTEGQVTVFVDSLSPYKVHSYDQDAAQYLGLTIECGHEDEA